MKFVLAKLLILPVKQECQSESDFSYKHSFVRFLMDSSGLKRINTRLVLRKMLHIQIFKNLI